MNKVDLISQEESDELEKEIHSINSLANVVRSVRCQVDLSSILNCQAYDSTVKSRKLFAIICSITICAFDCSN